MSLQELWRRRHWKVLLELIDRLPRNSRYRQAMALDEEIAEQFLEEGDGGKEARVQVHEFSPEVAQLMDLGNQVRLLRMEVAQFATGKSSNVEMLKGPETAMDRVAYRSRAREHYELSARLLPHKSEELLAKARDL